MIVRSMFLACVLAFGTGNTLAQKQSYDGENARSGAELRSVITGIVSLVYAPCPLSANPEKTAAFDQAVQRYEALKQTTVDHPSSIDFKIVEADYFYMMSLVDIACPELDKFESLNQLKTETMMLNSQLDRLSGLPELNPH